MKVLHISYFDTKGGAAKAAYRLNQSLNLIDIKSNLLVINKFSDDKAVIQVSTNIRIYIKLINKISLIILQFLGIKNASFGNNNLAFFNTKIISEILTFKADIIHLHWIGGDMISLNEIGKLKLPIVWTFHDMWPLCATEHLPFNQDLSIGNKWYKSYKTNSYLNFDRLVWLYKKFKFPNNIHIIAPSIFILDCVKKSEISRLLPSSVIHNAIDINSWYPLEKSNARSLLNLPQDIPLILLGSFGSHPLKGLDLFYDLINFLKRIDFKFELIIIGDIPNLVEIIKISKVHHFNFMHDDISLKLIYNSSDVLVIPSRFESFGLTASEAHACGIPVVGFDSSGLNDIIIHKETGYIAKSFDINDLAKGIQWVLDPKNYLLLSINARNKAVYNFSYEFIARKHEDLYTSLILKNNNF